MTVTVYTWTTPSSSPVEPLAPATAHDTNHAAVVNATVSGTWSAGNASGRTLSCVTNSLGQCKVTSGRRSRSTSASVNFTVANVTGTPPYLAAANHDPDGSSNGTTITVTKP